MPSTRKRPRALVIALLLLVATVVGCSLAEIALRLFVPPPHALGQLSYATADDKPITPQEGAKRGFIVPVTAPRPMDRPRMMFAPGQQFFLCYTDNDRLHRDWLDDKGRVEVRINKFGLRERDEITPDKPPGERRIVCIGDSFTFGWGIPEAMGWVRMLERELRKSGANWRTVNCGAAGTVCIDEYWWGLKERFHVFQPDAVILTICLNDLIPSSGLSLQGPAPKPTGSRLLDLAIAACSRSPLDLDPTFDWVGALLTMTKEEAETSLLAGADKPFEAMWSQGVPQKSLREAKAWCEARKIPFLVVLWPFLQGLGPGRYYPFQKLHDLVAADCKAADIPLLDVLPALRGTRDEDLWVTPADPHPNPLAERLALPAIVAFVQAHLP